MSEHGPNPDPTEAPIEPLYTHPASPFVRTEVPQQVDMPALPAAPSSWVVYRTQIEFGLAMVAYLMVLVGSVTVLQANPAAPWRYVVAVLPVVPATLTLTIFVRALSRLDELQKRIQMQAFGFDPADSGPSWDFQLAEAPNDFDNFAPLHDVPGGPVHSISRIERCLWRPGSLNQAEMRSLHRSWSIDGI